MPEATQRAVGAPSTDLISKGGPDGPIAVPFASAALIYAAVLALGFFIQSTVWQTNGDTSWLLTVIDRMHGGDRLFIDIIELNPPMSIWLYMPPAYLSYVTGIEAELLVRIYVLLICLLGISMTGWILRAGAIIPRSLIVPVLSCALLLTVTLSGKAFSERDHIGTVLVLPLIVLAAWRAGRSIVRPSTIHWIIAGLAGGMIGMVKPYYALILISAAGYVAWHRRDWRAFFLPEYLLAATMTVVYMATVWLVYPVFFSELLPLLNETYMAFSWPLPMLGQLAMPWLILPATIYILYRQGGRNALADLLLLTATVALAPYFIQGKGWAYHLYAATYLGSMAVIVAASTLLFEARRNPGDRKKFQGAEIVILAALTITVAHVRFLSDDGAPRSLGESVRTQVISPTVGLLGGDIAVGHPLSRTFGGRWIEPYCSDWLGVFANRMALKAEAEGDIERVRYYRNMFADYVAQKRERLLKQPPDVLIVATADGIVQQLLDDYDFSSILAGYTPIAREGSIEVYRRNDAPRPASPAN